jgi:hypothetical protein
MLLPENLRDDMAQFAAEARADAALASAGTGSCAGGGTAVCETTLNQDSSGTMTGTVADIIRKLLALTGWGAIPWIVAAGVLAVLGTVAIHQSRNRKGDSLGSA